MGMPRTMASDLVDKQREMKRRFNMHWSCARDAVRYVTSKMTYGAMDKQLDVFSALIFDGIWMRNKVGDMRDKVETETRERIAKESRLPGADARRFGTGGDEYWRIRIETEARRAALDGCGNCGEQSSIAFVYLRDLAKVAPLDYLEYLDGDHAFVLIGRAEEAFPQSPGTWGDSVVICNPWDEMVHTREEFMTRYPGRFASRFRYNG